MAKFRKTSPAVGIVKTVIVFIVWAFLIFVGYKAALSFCRSCDYFTVKDIWYESTLQAIQSSELSALKGKNLFDVDLKKAQRQLQSRYPQFKELVVLKRFPNQILVVAKKRPVFAQVKAGARTVVVDEKGVVLSIHSDEGKDLPFIVGINGFKSKIVPGVMMEGESLQTALGIIRAFLSEKNLSSHRMIKIDISNLSEIFFYLEDNLKIIIDRENVAHKLKMLGLVLAQAKPDPREIRYVDLRFKEPILGKHAQ